VRCGFGVLRKTVHAMGWHAVPTVELSSAGPVPTALAQCGEPRRRIRPLVFFVACACAIAALLSAATGVAHADEPTVPPSSPAAASANEPGSSASAPAAAPVPAPAAEATPAPPPASTPAPAAAASGTAAPRQKVFAAPRLAGRLTAKEVGLVINTNDPYSVEVGAFYKAARKLTDAQVLRVQLPMRAELSQAELEMLQLQIDRFFGDRIQALALAWVQPFAVGCNSITGALALGFDPVLCTQSCAPSRVSPYFNAATLRPHNDLKMRPSMLLAAKSVPMAEAMIERGVASDHTLGWWVTPPVNAAYLITSDAARSTRSVLFPPPGPIRSAGVDVYVQRSDVLSHIDRLLLYETGLAVVPSLDTLKWMPGAIGDHLTSYGGRIDGTGGQMSALEWIASGATGTYGTVSEPCSHPQKFPHPQLVLLHYIQGASLIEAYWKSVAWPQQGLFIGEPLAAPFSKR
jgi:uncharacterized protein (TIGR03790 family)